MRNTIYKEDVINSLQNLIALNEGDEATKEILTAMAADILDEPMEEVDKEIAAMEDYDVTIAVETRYTARVQAHNWKEAKEKAEAEFQFVDCGELTDDYWDYHAVNATKEGGETYDYE